MITWLQGKKTYILQIGLVLYVIGGVVTHHMGVQEALGLLFSAGTIASIRSAISSLQLPPQ